MDPQMMLQLLLKAIEVGAWPIVAAVVVGAVVRATKPDIRIMPTVPARYRPLVGAAVAIVLGASDAIVMGTPWRKAGAGAAAAFALAWFGHVFGIEIIRGGKELPMPKVMTIPPAPKTPDETPTDPPPTMRDGDPPEAA